MSKNLCRAFISRVLTSSHLQMNQMRCCHDAKKVKVKVVGLLTVLPMAQLFFPIIDNIDSIAFQKNSLRQGTDFPDKWTLINHLWLSQLFDFVVALQSHYKVQKFYTQILMQFQESNLALFVNAPKHTHNWWYF